MEKILSINVLKIGIISATILLSSCGKQNPLMAEQYVNTMKHELKNLSFLERETNKPTINCPPYLANQSRNPSLKDECDKWAEKTYKLIMNKGELPYQTTLEQFKDPALWKAVLPK